MEWHNMKLVSCRKIHTTPSIISIKSKVIFSWIRIKLYLWVWLMTSRVSFSFVLPNRSQYNISLKTLCPMCPSTLILHFPYWFIWHGEISNLKIEVPLWDYGQIFKCWNNYSSQFAIIAIPVKMCDDMSEQLLLKITGKCALTHFIKNAVIL